jgi:hypothetical protein
VANAIAVLGENVVVKRVARLAVGSGVVGGYVHAGGKLGVLVALEAADGGASLAGLAKDIAMHIAAADPSPVAVEPRGHLARAARGRARDLPQAGARVGQAREDPRPDRRREDRQVRVRGGAGRAAFVKDPDKSIGDADQGARRERERLRVRAVQTRPGGGGARGVKAAYRRLLVKLSGEQLAGKGGFGISPTVIKRIAQELREVHELGVDLCVVIGGGNVIRGITAASEGWTARTPTTWA